MVWAFFDGDETGQGSADKNPCEEAARAAKKTKLVAGDITAHSLLHDFDSTQPSTCKQHRPIELAAPAQCGFISRSQTSRDTLVWDGYRRKLVLNCGYFEFGKRGGTESPDERSLAPAVQHLHVSPCRLLRTPSRTPTFPNPIKWTRVISRESVSLRFPTDFPMPAVRSDPPPRRSRREERLEPRE